MSHRSGSKSSRSKKPVLYWSGEFIGLSISDTIDDIIKKNEPLTKSPSFIFFSSQSKVLIDFSRLSEIDFKIIKNFFYTMTPGTSFNIINGSGDYLDERGERIEADIAGTYSFTKMKGKVIESVVTSLNNLNSRNDTYDSKFFLNIPQFNTNDTSFSSDSWFQIKNNSGSDSQFSFKNYGGVIPGDLIRINTTDNKGKFEVINYQTRKGIELITISSSTKLVEEDLIGNPTLISIYRYGWNENTLLGNRKKELLNIRNSNNSIISGTCCLYTKERIEDNDTGYEFKAGDLYSCSCLKDWECIILADRLNQDYKFKPSKENSNSCNGYAVFSGSPNDNLETKCLECEHSLFGDIISSQNEQINQETLVVRQNKLNVTSNRVSTKELNKKLKDLILNKQKAPSTKTKTLQRNTKKSSSIILNDSDVSKENNYTPPTPRLKRKTEVVIENSFLPLGHSWLDPRRQTVNNFIEIDPSLPTGHPGSCEPHIKGPAHELSGPEARKYYAGIYKISPIVGIEKNVEWEERLNPGWIRFIWEDNTPQKEATYNNLDYVEISTAESDTEIQLDLDDLLISYPNTPWGGCQRDFGTSESESFYEYVSLQGQGTVVIHPVNPAKSGSEWIKLKYSYAGFCYGLPWIQLHGVQLDSGSAHWRESLFKLKQSASCPNPNDNESCLKRDMHFLDEPHYYYVFFDYVWDQWREKRKFTHNSNKIEGPFGIEGFYPLYNTKKSADGASPNMSGSYKMKINSSNYYMPNGLTLGKTKFHGDYKGGVYSYGPFSIGNYYPLYRTEDAANADNPNNSGSYPRIIKGLTYYIPNGWKE